jgi:hypothetical protein
MRTGQQRASVNRVTRAIALSVICAIVLATSCDKQPSGPKSAGLGLRNVQGLPGRDEIMGLPMGTPVSSVIEYFNDPNMRFEDMPHIRIGAKGGGEYWLFFQNPTDCHDSRHDRLLLIGAVFAGPNRAAPVLVLPRARAGDVVTWAECELLFPVCATPSAD